MSARFDLAVQEAFYWSEILDNGGSFADYGEVCSPGISAALSGLWRGRNRADNESVKEQSELKRKAQERAEQRKRYAGGD